VIEQMWQHSLRIFHDSAHNANRVLSLIQKEWNPKQRKYVHQISTGNTESEQQVAMQMASNGKIKSEYESAIPKVIYIIAKYDLCELLPSHRQQAIHRDDPFYYELLINVQKIKDLHPDYAVKCFDDYTAYDYILRTRHDEEFAGYFQNEQSGMYKSDLFRIFLLFHEGGYYFDSDMEPRMSLNAVTMSKTGPTTFVTAIAADGERVFQSILGATKGNAILKRNLDLMRSHYALKLPLPNNMGTWFMAKALEYKMKIHLRELKKGGEVVKSREGQILRLFLEQKYRGFNAALVLPQRTAGKSWDYMFEYAVYDPVSKKYPFWSRFTGYGNAEFRALQ